MDVASPARPSESPDPTFPAPSVVVSREVDDPPPLAPESEVKAFWARELEGLFKERILTGQTEYAVLNAQLRESRVEIRKRYGRDLEMRMVANYAKAGWLVMMGSLVSKGQPAVELIIPSLMILHHECAKRGHDARRAFELAILVGFLHELDHLALGEVGRSTHVESEKRAWARTCERTIRPLVEFGAPVEAGHRIYYDAWVSARRDERSPKWDAFIRTHYGALTTPPKP